MWSGAKIIIQWAVGLFVVGLIVALVVDGYQSLDNSGWITHDHDTPVWIQGDWLVGEYRDCQMRTKTVPAQRKDLDSLNELPRLFCAEDANGVSISNVRQLSFRLRLIFKCRRRGPCIFSLSQGGNLTTSSTSCLCVTTDELIDRTNGLSHGTASGRVNLLNARL